MLVRGDVSLSTALSKDIDGIDVGKMSKGGASATISAYGTSSEIVCTGFNSVLLFITVSGGTGTFTIHGAPASGGTFMECYDGSTKMEVAALAANRCVFFRGIPDVIKIVSSGTGTITVKAVPLNV